MNIRMVKIMSKDIKMIDRIINDLNVVRNTLTANEATIDYLSKRNKELENQVCELESARRINDSNIVRLSKKLTAKETEFSRLREKYARDKIIAEKNISQSIDLRKKLFEYETAIERGELCWNVSSIKEHYAPGDTIVFKRLTKIGEADQYGNKWSFDEYTNAVENMIYDGFFFLEIPSIDKPITFETCVRVENIIGHIIEFDEETITVETLSKYTIPESGAKFLSSLTKKEIDEKIRICHKMIITKKLGQRRVISCYLVEKGLDIQVIHADGRTGTIVYCDSEE